MVKLYYTLTSFMLLLATSCTTGSFDYIEGGDVATNGMVDVVLPISSSGSLSRTELADNLTDVKWSIGDELSLWADGADNDETNLTGEKFTLKYYGATYDRADFSGSIIAMNEEQSYTYRAFYPYTTTYTADKVVSYTLPASQDGVYDGKYDFRVADSTTGGALTSSADDSFDLTFRSLTHALRITIPEGYNAMNVPIKRLILTFTTTEGEAIDVVGDLALDMTAAGATPSISSEGNILTAELGENTITDGDGNYVWLFINPLAAKVSGDITISAVGTGEEWSYDYVIPFSDRDFSAGHITPINTAIGEEMPSTTLTITITENNIGEDLSNIVVTAPTGAWFKESKANSVTIENDGSDVYTMSYLTNDSDNASIKSGSLSVDLMSPQTKVPKTFSLANITENEVNNFYETVPYLLIEDFTLTSSFSSNVTGATNGSWSSSSGSKSAISLSDYGLPSGWYGARVGGDKTAGAVGICCRYESAVNYATTVSDSRIDSPALSYIRDDLGEDGAQIIVKYKYKGGRKSGYKTGSFPFYYWYYGGDGTATYYAGLTETQGGIKSPSGGLLGTLTGDGHELAEMDVTVIQGDALPNTTGDDSGGVGNNADPSYSGDYLDDWGEFSTYYATSSSRVSFSSSTTFSYTYTLGVQGNFWMYITDLVVQVVPQTN